MIEFMVGPATAEWLPVLEEELALAESDPRAPTWRKADVAPEATLRVAIVGAGMSGLLAAHRLQQVGVEHTILAKHPNVGGTRLANNNPGCRDISEERPRGKECVSMGSIRRAQES